MLLFCKHLHRNNNQALEEKIFTEHPNKSKQYVALSTSEKIDLHTETPVSSANAEDLTKNACSDIDHALLASENLKNNLISLTSSINKTMTLARDIRSEVKRISNNLNLRTDNITEIPGINIPENEHNNNAS